MSGKPHKVFPSRLPCSNRAAEIAQGIKGIDPDGTDNERANSETAWLKAHPAITEAEREKLRGQGEKNKVYLTGEVVKKRVVERVEMPSKAKDVNSYGKDIPTPENADITAQEGNRAKAANP